MGGSTGRGWRVTSLTSLSDDFWLHLPWLREFSPTLSERLIVRAGTISEHGQKLFLISASYCNSLPSSILWHCNHPVATPKRALTSACAIECLKVSYIVTASVNMISDEEIHISLLGTAAHGGGQSWKSSNKEHLTSASDGKEIIARQTGDCCVDS